jgi:hypothetical protein
MSDNTKFKIFTISLAGLFCWFIFLAPQSFEWKTEAEINAFPSNESSKSYRLTAYTNATEYKRGWFHLKNEFNVTSADWPNGGRLDFNECYIVDQQTATCNDDEGEEWQVDIHSFGDRQNEDYSGDEY